MVVKRQDRWKGRTKMARSVSRKVRKTDKRKNIMKRWRESRKIRSETQEKNAKLTNVGK